MTTPRPPWNRDIVFLDTETLGLRPAAPTWEFAAMRFSHDGMSMSRSQFFIEHDPSNADPDLPPEYWADYRKRYDPELAYTEHDAAKAIARMTHMAYVVGCNPGFDLNRLSTLLQDNDIRPPWYHHPLDITSIVLGYFVGQGHPAPPSGQWKSDLIALTATGVDATKFQRHTALGDVDWMIAQWSRIFDGAHVELWRHVFGGVPS